MAGSKFSKKIKYYKRRLRDSAKVWIYRAINFLRFIRSERKVFIDCGSNDTAILERFLKKYKKWDFYAFEPQPELIEDHHRIIKKYSHRNIEFSSSAVWDRNGEEEFFLAKTWKRNYKDRSTLVESQGKNRDKIDYEHPITVKTIDFSEWLMDHFSARDYVVVKMDIEGSEYRVLKKIIDDGNAKIVNEFFIEFHDVFLSARDKNLTEILRRQLKRTSGVFDWY